MAVRLTFFGGVGEIGGNKLLVEDGDTRFFIDFGVSFASETKYFSGYLCPRSVNGVGDYLEFNLLPRLKGLYSREQVESAGIRYSEPRFDGVLLSHAHMDHCGHLSFLDENIVVHCGETAKFILDSLEETGSTKFGDRRFKTFRTGDRVKVGGLKVEPIHVDHSIPGAYGFIVHTSEGAIIYTGDLRLHGPMAAMTREFVEKARDAEPIAMVSEGTRVSERERYVTHSEEEVRRMSFDVVAEAKKLVAAAFYGRDVDRFRTFYRVAVEHSRRFVIPTRLAHLLTKLKVDPKLKVPDVIKDENILVYMKRKRTGSFDERDYYLWERPFLDKAVNFKYVKENQSEIIFNLDLVGFAELIDVIPDAGGEFIYSRSEPFSEEDVEHEVMQHWLTHYGLKYRPIHASGHASRSVLMKEIIAEISPKQIFPIHTEEPELFSKLVKGEVGKVVLPQKNVCYEVSSTSVKKMKSKVHDF